MSDKAMDSITTTVPLKIRQVLQIYSMKDIFRRTMYFQFLFQCLVMLIMCIILVRAEEDPSLRIESFTKINCVVFQVT